MRTVSNSPVKIDEDRLLAQHDGSRKSTSDGGADKEGLSTHVEGIRTLSRPIMARESSTPQSRQRLLKANAPAAALR